MHFDVDVYLFATVHGRCFRSWPTPENHRSWVRVKTWYSRSQEERIYHLLSLLHIIQIQRLKMSNQHSNSQGVF